MNDYRKLMEDISVPKELNGRVLRTARQRGAEQTGSKRLAKRNWRPVLRGAVCAACALALVVGTVHLRPAEESGEQPGGSPVMTLDYSFGLTAYAAETGETYGVGEKDCALAFQLGLENRWSRRDGFYTGCLMQITGQGIRQVSLSLDSGEFYRWLPGESEERLGNCVTEAYDPAARYGFWVAGEDPGAWEKDAREAAKASVDALNGATLTVTVTFDDGMKQSRMYGLSTGPIKVIQNGDGTQTILPQMAEEDGAYGILAEPVTVGAVAETAARRFELLPYGGDREKAQENADRGRVFFSNGNWAGGSEDGKKLCQIFRIQGEGIQTVSASMSKGAFWRGYMYAAEDEQSVPNEITLSRELFGTDPESCGVQGRYLTLAWNVENGFTEEYDPRFCYGLRILPEEVEAMEAAEEYQSPFTFFDGAVLSITVTFDDGTAETQNYCLRADLFQGTRDEETGLYVDLTEELDPEQADNWFKGIQAKRLEWPVQGSETLRLSAPYGKASNGTVHNGLDIPAAQGTPVLAAADGTVCETGFDPERGKYLVLDHGNGLRTVYGHCRSVDVERGDTVRAGEMVASVGATGLATGPHLHFEVHLDGETQDPVPCFAGSVQDTLKVK